ncbi:MAG: 4Fe-4S ferredoxin [Proteobacteria bacterium]|nr:4Fe-4S ferredoxin [Pseudomonadota bacterium]NIS67993.1 4Fe-4S ferredoxin [Pseudomonadota bacterium]
MRVVRKIVEIEEDKCDGCGQCVPSCAEGAIQIVDGKARLVAEKFCDGLGACIGECPLGALKVVERAAEDFDEKAVEKHLKTRETMETTAEAAAFSCSSATMQSFSHSASNPKGTEPPDRPEAESALTHWPIQIHLVPPTAPFLKGADLLVLADCTPVAYPNLHQDLLKGKTVMMGCPKFDDAEAYVRKFGEIFDTANIRTVTVAVMEVPCCQALPVIVKKGMELARKEIPMEKVVVRRRGDVLARAAA